MPRPKPRPPHPHPTAAAAAAAPQVKPPQAPLGAEKTATMFTTTNRSSRVVPFDPGHDWETEIQCAKAFHRPPRHYKSDPPFYPGYL